MLISTIIELDVFSRVWHLIIIGGGTFIIIICAISYEINDLCRAVARTLIGGGGCIFIYSGSARLVSFEIKLISKEVSRA